MDNMDNFDLNDLIKKAEEQLEKESILKEEIEEKERLEKLKQTKIEFNKAFANGRQYIEISKITGEIIDIEKTYFWQERGAYNRIQPLIALAKSKIKDLDDEDIYGENGLVERLIPIQKSYNQLKNRNMEYLNRLICPTLAVEDGSVDMDELEMDGLTPGKVLVYRQGSKAPEFVNYEDMSKLDFFASAEERLIENFYYTVSGFIMEKENDKKD